MSDQLEKITRFVSLVTGLDGIDLVVVTRGASVYRAETLKKEFEPYIPELAKFVSSLFDTATSTHIAEEPRIIVTEFEDRTVLAARAGDYTVGVLGIAPVIHELVNQARRIIGGKELRCPNCGNVIDVQVYTCPKCGHRVPFTATKCPFCGADLSVKKCPSCGTMLRLYVDRVEPATGTEARREVAPEARGSGSSLVLVGGGIAAYFAVAVVSGINIISAAIAGLPMIVAAVIAAWRR